MEFFPIPIKSNNSLKITVDYWSIIKELEKRLGKCPDNVKNALKDMQQEELENNKELL